jgi:pimeloyl-ACP methyl ester carboxylesterase
MEERMAHLKFRPAAAAAAAAFVVAATLTGTAAAAGLVTPGRAGSTTASTAAVESVATKMSSAAARDCARPGRQRRDFPAGYDAATRRDAAFNATFVHCFSWVDGVRMHYVTGGKGTQTLLLLHGWPQTWYGWHKVMPELAKNYRLIVADLPGLGDSQGSPPDYTKRTLAEYMHSLVTKTLGVPRVGLVTHDLGAGVGYQYAANYRDSATGWINMDFPLVGRQITAESLRGLSYHFALHYQPDNLAEKLIDDRHDVREYLTSFYPHVSAQVPNPITDDEIDEFVRTYRRPAVLHGGFELYRTLFADEKDNIEEQRVPLTIPVTLITQAGALAFELPATQAAAPAARGVESSVGHWIPDNQPRLVIDEVRRAFPTP